MIEIYVRPVSVQIEPRMVEIVKLVVVPPPVMIENG